MNLTAFQASVESVRSRMADLAAAPPAGADATAALKLKLSGLTQATNGAGSAASPTGINNNHSRQDQAEGGGGGAELLKKHYQHQQQKQQSVSDTRSIKWFAPGCVKYVSVFP